MRKITLRNDKGEDISFIGKLHQRDDLSTNEMKLILQMFITNQKQIILDIDYETQDEAAHVALQFETPKDASAFMEKVTQEVHRAGNIFKAMMN